MTPLEHSALLWALGANLAFAVGVQFFTRYSRSVSSLWVNCSKALFATAAFLLTVLVGGGFHSIDPGMAGLFVASGALGLGLADVFILKSFALMGPGRTLLLFGFQPLLVGSLSWLMFGQTVDPRRFLAILFFVACLAVFSVESRRRTGRWEWRALLIAMAGMCFDSFGVIITRYAFDASPGIAAMEGNLYRGLGAVLFFAVLSRWRPIDLAGRWRALSRSDRLMVAVGAFLGTYLSLAFYLRALRHGHLASISGIAITGTLLASLFECLLERRAPSRYHWTALVFFLGGMWTLFGFS